MTNAHDAIEATVADLERLRKLVAKGAARQLSNATDLDVIKANVHTWLRTRRPLIAAVLDQQSLAGIDDVFSAVLAATHRATLRSRYLTLIKSAKRLLGTMQTANAVTLAASNPATVESDTPPQFASIAGDPAMQKILQNRWVECGSCVAQKLPLAATVMMGGLLEAVLLARINQLPDKKPVFTAATAPKDKKSGSPLSLKEWGLSNYIDVANEIGWLSDTYKDVGSVLRDYRNYIHPLKEYQHKKSITPDDAKVLWNISKSMMSQLL